MSRVKEIDELDLNLKEVEVRYSSDNLDFRGFTSSSELASIEDIDTTFAAVI